MPVCEVCLRSFDTSRGLRQHYLRHEKLPLLALPDLINVHQNINVRHEYAEEDLDAHEAHIEIQVEGREIGENNLLGSDLYLEYQSKFCFDIYGPSAFRCHSWNSFVQAVKQKPKGKTSKRDLNAFKLHNFCTSRGFTRSTSVELIKLINEVSEPSKDVPSGWYQVESTAKRGTLETVQLPLTAVVPFPERWCMENWETSKHGVKPSPVGLLVRDPITCIAEQWMDPSIAFAFKDHIKLEYVAEFQPNEGTHSLLVIFITPEYNFLVLMFV